MPIGEKEEYINFMKDRPGQGKCLFLFYCVDSNLVYSCFVRYAHEHYYIGDRGVQS